MSRLIIPIVLVVALFLFVAKVHISFNPLSISLERPFLALGYVLLGLAISVISAESYKDGYRKAVDSYKTRQEISYLKGYRDAMAYVNEEFRQEVNEYLKKHQNEKDSIQ